MARKSRTATTVTRRPSAAVLAAQRGERSFVERHGRPVAAVVTIDDYELLERIVKRLEDELDLESIRRSAKRREKGMPLAAFVKRLGLG